MESAFECFQHAADCERRAEATGDQANKAALLTAANWRTAGNAAKLLERIVPPREHQNWPPQSIRTLTTLGDVSSPSQKLRCRTYSPVQNVPR